MDDIQLLALYDRQQRQEIEYPETRRQVTPDGVRHVPISEVSGNGMIIYSRLNETNVENAIRRQIAYFETIGRSFEWKVYSHDTPADLKDRLQAHGFEVGEVEAIMVLDLESIPAKLLQPVAHDIRRIVDPARIQDIVAIESEVWQEDFSSLGLQLSSLLRNYPNALSLYIAYDGELPVSCAWIDFTENSEFAGLWGGSTLPAYRKRGLYTALLAVRAQEARQRGIRFLTVDASPMSRPILEKLGFRLITYAYACNWTVNKDNVR